MREDVLADGLGALLGHPLCVAVEVEGPGTLTPAEEQRQAALGESPGLGDWRRGRSALKRVLGQLGRDVDTAALRWPDAEVSLTHAAGRAVAAGARGALGVGVDLEMDRVPSPGVERFYLTAAEQAWLAGRPEARRASDRLRLWTVKEAVFKADLRNRGAMVGDYALDAPAALAGRARCGGRVIRYASMDLGRGWISAALAEEVARC